MTPPDVPDLFTAAGLVLAETPPRKPKRKAKRPRKPTPAERAAAARALGARRSVCPCDEGVRSRVGGPRDLNPRKVFGYPLSHNKEMVQVVVDRLPHGYDDDFEDKWAYQGRLLSEKLMRRGIPKPVAREMARDLIDEAFHIKVDAAHKEAGRR